MSAPTSVPSSAGTTSVASTLPELIVLFNSTWATLGAWTSSIPGSQVAWRYIKASHQDDPFRTVLELLLVFFIVRTYAQSRTKGEQSGKNFVKLTEKEIDELVHEWQPEALLPPAPTTTQYPPVIIGATGPRPRVVFPSPGQDPHDPVQPYDVNSGTNQGKVVLNLASSNFAGLAGNERIKDKAVKCLKRYGVGSCGPPGFYGTFDVHMELERDIAAFLSVPSVIMYSHSFSTISSVIPSFSKRGDIIVADRGVNFAIQKGIQISRSNIRWYDHGDYEALERILEQIHKEDKKYKRKVTNGRRFIITEGIFENDGSMVDLPKVMELKLKYKYRLILDETWSFGVVGKTGRGVTEVFDIPTAEVDMLVGSMANGLSSTGGFCAGSKEVVAHQRINSPGFVFSAALPPLLAVSASEAISMLSIPANMSSPAHPLAPLPENVAALRKIVDSVKPIEIPSAEMSPMIHICIRDDDKLYPEPLTREEQEMLLQDVVEQCGENGVLVTRTKRNWAQEMVEHRPSLRICVTAALTKKEIEKAGNVLKSALNKVLAGKKK
ncbi:BQ2448_4650 [Microbotryum intermedium]|uniref:serine C-palmitoyltransferase n=1 Tax=Microbotryum intermedium TaxID=269621 RepID=A0A238FLK1_9BASI|nr:BQ2448_4650 [Microbotryum intermedium]